MAFHLLYGEHPVSLIDTCLSRICDEAVKWPTRRGYIIVPEKMKAEIERRYIEILQEKKGGKSDAAFMMIDVVSFSRFAYRVLSEVGGMGGKAMSPAARTILIHRILSENKDEFSVLSSFSERVGFVSDLDEVLGDFYRYGISGQMLEEMDLSAESPLTASKIHDFGHLLNKMDSLRQELGYSPERDSMKRLDEVLRLFMEDAPETKTWPLKRLSFLRDASCWILGFGETRNFTPEEHNIVTKLAAVTSKVTMTCIAGSDKEEEMGEDICHFGEKTISSILKVFPLDSSEMAGPVAARNEALSTLSSDYAARSCEKRKDLDVPCEIKVFHQISDELEYIAARIKKAVQFENLRYRDITVVMCDMEQYSASLHAAFSKYGLDAFVDSNQPIMGTIWTQYLTSILDMSVFHFDLSSVMGYLKSGFVTVDADVLQQFENFCLAHGVRTKKKMLSCDKYVSTVSEKKVVEVVLPIIQKVADDLTSIEKAKTLRERAVALHDMVCDKKKNVEYFVDEWQKAGNQQAALALALSCNYADDALVAMASELGDFPISLSNFRDALLSALENKTLQAIPSYVDQVTITTPANAYRRACKMMFIVGSQRKNFPYTSPSEGYLRNRERAVISEKLSMEFPNHAKDQSYADFFTAYALMDAPSERLIFTIQNSVEPSSVVIFITDNYPKVRSEILDHLTQDDPRVLIRAKMEDYLRDVLTGHIKVSDKEYDEAVFIWQNYFASSELSYEHGPVTDLSIPKELMDKRYGDRLLMSVSSVESYLYCPYHYFCEKVLKIKEREIQQVQATEMGTLGHTIMEKALTEFREAYLAVSTPEEKQAVLEQYRAKDKLSWSREILLAAQESERYAYCDDPALKMSADTKLLAGTSETLSMIFSKLDPENNMPTVFEWHFGGDGIPGYDMTLSDGRIVTFNGTIDRVDVNEKENTFSILDYKTGNKKIDFDALYSGASVQLPSYLHVYYSQHPDLSPDGVSYIHVSRVKKKGNALSESFDPQVQEEERTSAVEETYEKGYSLSASTDDMKKMGEFAISRVKENCEKLYSGQFDARPAKIKKKPLLKCPDCEYNQICNGDPDSPDYRYLDTLPALKTEKGTAMKKNDVFFKKIRGEEE